MSEYKFMGSPFAFTDSQSNLNTEISFFANARFYWIFNKFRKKFRTFLFSDKTESENLIARNF